MSIKSELQELFQNGILQPANVVEWAAANPESAVYKSLEWDDIAASHAYRIWQVRRLIAVHIVTPDRRREVISLSIDRVEAGGGYRTIETVMRSNTMRQIALTDAMRELDRVRNKYDSLIELQKVWDAIDIVKQAKQSSAERGVAWLSKAKHSGAKSCKAGRA